jgi:hypothetical protein
MPILSLLQPPPTQAQFTDEKGYLTPTWQKWFQQAFSRMGGAVALPNLAIGDTTTPIINAFVASSNTTLYTSPTGITSIVDSFTVTNVDNVAHMISVYIVPSGGSPQTSNQIITSLSMPANQTTSISTMVSQVVGSGRSIIAISDLSSVLKVSANGRQVS